MIADEALFANRFSIQMPKSLKDTAQYDAGLRRADNEDGLLQLMAYIKGLF